MDTSESDVSLLDEIKALRQQIAVLYVDLSGKDWLTIEEAAHYCGVSVSQFNARAHEYDLDPRKFMGKKLYAKSALYQAIYSAKAWTRPSATSAPTLAATSPEMKEALARLRRYDERKVKR
ncbi:helix-turn-helix domain-containing protein [Stenotrophomonas maltophilia]|uniref:helix-turn-helix domain-containing protein n=1 Tax=Stenotrophomonas maltophilia TaxID=40324 RepID=UPI001311E742|nr:helix-turn-helix domain-containing protein [Stenotrophomonas maltophilia]MCO7456857.1 helix-turn-helix domain-containing protein [Stenotrophomonas maltophilia]MCO7465270.1 helix-turn-helix domain-containing protein [Stenotrophomonas maltophilia]MCO7483095.1 helix-turn-helix domain-containing protein [Stenotrophomonas maltophilia]MCO7491941.1 helix-turn-helix domain-containing protein [Stenotrophomonas maltophilia]